MLLDVKKTLFICFMSLLLGFLFSSWNLLYLVFSPILKPMALHYLLAGPWLMPAPFLMLFFLLLEKNILIQDTKSHSLFGIGFLASFISSVVTMTLGHWGPMSLLWGFLQALGTETAFYVFHRTPNKKIKIFGSLCCGSFLSASLSFILDFYFYHYHKLSDEKIFRMFASFQLSALIFSSLLTYFFVSQLLARVGDKRIFKTFFKAQVRR